MDTFLALDRAIFLAINHFPHTLLLDWFALFLSGVGTAGFIWLVFGFILFLREEKKDHRFWIPFVTAGSLSWMMTEFILKPIVSRSRPGLELGAIIVGQGNSGFSFPSGHATTAFAMATVLAAYEPRFGWIFVSVAILISWSRVYLGVHYSSDVIAGALLGWAIGKMALFFTKYRQTTKTRAPARRGTRRMR